MQTVLDLTAEQAEVLHEEVAAFLAAAAPRTAHPLVTRTTDELVAEALAVSTPPAPAPTLAPPPRITRWLPERAWRAVGRARTRRDVTAAEYLGLLVLVLDRHGWTGAGARRTTGGCRCIAGAQELLAALGYGSNETATAAARAIQAVLHRRGVREPYWAWNDAPGRRRDEVLAVLREAVA